MSRRTAKTRSRLGIELLETREMPATLVSPTTVTYQDTDGDRVTVTLSKPLLKADNVNTLFTFDVGSVDGDNAGNQELESIELTSLGTAANGVRITTRAVRANGGDGLAVLGHIDASGIDIGTVTIDGDLGRLLAGDAAHETPGLKGLTVHSLGRFRGTGAPDLSTVVVGACNFLNVQTELSDGTVHVQSGKLGPVKVGHSLFGAISADLNIGMVTIGGVLAGTDLDNSGSIFTLEDLAGLKIGGFLSGGAGNFSGRVVARNITGMVTIGGDLNGGTGFDTAQLRSRGYMKGVKVAGSVLGTTGTRSARIHSDGDMGKVTIGGDLQHGPDALPAGGGQFSGQVEAGGKLAGVTVGGSVAGGSILSGGDMGPVTIGKDFARDAVRGLGGIVASQGGLAKIKVVGSVVGGWAISGSIYSKGPMGMVTIGGNLTGADAEGSGSIHSDASLAGVKVGGSVLGGAGKSTGSIFATGDLGMVNIVGDLKGSDGERSGRVEGNDFVSVNIGGSLLGGVGNESGCVESFEIGTLSIGGNVTGSDGVDSGRVKAIDGPSRSVKIVGSLLGGAGTGSGQLWFHDIKTLSIGGDIKGGSASGDVALIGSGYFSAKHVGRFTLGGSLIAGTDNTDGEFIDNGAISFKSDVGTMLVKGSIVGNETYPAIVDVFADGMPATMKDRAIGSLRVLGDVQFGRIAAGAQLNADAQIGSVFVGGDWTASSISAGVAAGDDFYGNGDDFKTTGGFIPAKDVASVTSRIGSVTIVGKAGGTVGGTDHFGVVAENVGSVTVGGKKLVLTAGNNNDDLAVGDTGDFRVNEI